jgi:homoserine kinase
MVMMHPVDCVRVPASSANMGPGFDALGMALSLYLDAGVVDSEANVPADARIVDDHHPTTIAFRFNGGEGRLWVRGSIPMGRGLGYSGAARVAGVVAAQVQREGSDEAVLVGARRHLLHVCTELEGHPDNVAASLVGGVTASSGGEVVRLPLAIDPAVLVWVPDTQTSTEKSRTSIPAHIALADVVFNIGHTALLMGALASGDVSVLRQATQDRLHQDRRLEAAPTSKAALEAALATDAWCAWLSGSGPTIALLCDRGAAAEIARRLPTDGRVHELSIDLHGARILPTA